MFRDGMAIIRGHTEDRGWVKEKFVRIPGAGGGARYYDNYLENKRGRDGHEYKSGRVGKETLRQLNKDDRAIRLGLLNRLELITVQGSRIDGAVLEKLAQLRAKYGDAVVTHRVVTREEYDRAMKVAGKAARERVRAEREREQRARDLELARVLEKSQQVARQRKELAKEVRGIGPREVGESPSRAMSSAINAKLGQVRGVERDQADALLISLGFGKSARDAMGKVLAEGRDRRDATLIREVEAVTRSAEAADTAEQTRVREAEAERARRERETSAEKARERQREAAERLARAAREVRAAAERGQSREMSGREIADLLEVGWPTPGAEPSFREPPSAGSTRSGREERGLSRER